MVAACEKRLVFSDAIETFLQQLGVAEVMVGEMRDAGIGKHSSVTLKEQLENLEVSRIHTGICMLCTCLLYCNLNKFVITKFC